jgi:curli production assembly/transport component CsgF
MKKLIFMGLTIIMFAGSNNSAQQLVFSFSNPSFIGGNIYNGSYLLSQAEAQNDKTASSSDISGSSSEDELSDFKASLNAQILSQLSRQIVSNAFGEDSLEEGRYELGDYIIDVTPGGSGINITIQDIVTGGETTITVPYY